MDIEFPEEALPKEGSGGGGDFEPLPDGSYLADIAESKMVDFSTGSKGLKVAFKIADGDYAGRQVFENFPMAENCLWKLAKLFDAAGIDVSSGKVKGFKASNLLAARVKIKLGSRTYNDKVYNQVLFIDPPPGGAAKKTKTGFSL